MKKIIIGIFAHPDDEAFGPGGTLVKLSKENDVYLICVTNGGSGQNSLNSKKNLGEIRSLELRESAKVLGVKEVYFLGFEDGNLSNNLYHKVADEIKKVLDEIKPDIIITFEPRGVSGHIDHIAVSMISSFIFWKSKFINEMWQFCGISNDNFEKQDYFIYFPPGYKKEEVDKVVKTDDVWDTKVKAMLCHKSQAHDLERFLSFIEKAPKEEYFLVTKKS